MSEEPQDRPGRRTKLWFGLAIVLIFIALLVVPPLISINRYKSRITQLVSRSLGRPVRLSGVELRMLPRPGFLLSDLTVEEEPAFGAEPILHATTVMASIRFSSLWRGHLEISRISVDDASLNLVYTPQGHWNLDSLFRTAAAQPGASAARRTPLPYMEATNARINIKNGAEKLPFSLLSADASLSQDGDGVWTVRLKGQPARTDVSLDLPDTGIVRLEATMHPAAQIREMPLHLDLDWRSAQLGQLSRLVLGSDEGWRGDLTGELHLDGNGESAQVKTRLRAAGVHRAEFAPAAPLDFDASCSFVYQYNHRTLQKLQCDSPIGDGRARLTKAAAEGTQSPKFTLELDRIPAQAALDVLRTMRSNLDPTLQAQGSVSGHMTYDPNAPTQSQPAPPTPPTRKTRAVHSAPAAPEPLTGSFTVDALRLSGDALSKPVMLGKMTLDPAPVQPGQPMALAAAVTIPAGAPAPLTVTLRLELASFEASVHGPVALARLKEFARVAGIPGALDQLAGEPAVLDLTTQGPWLPPIDVRLSSTVSPPASASQPPPMPSVEISGTITLHDANWHPDFLANAVLVNSATLHVENGSLRWNPIAFTYGPVKGTAAVDVPGQCAKPDPCRPRLSLKFGVLDAADLQSAILGARQSGTLLSSLLDKLKPTSPTWPQIEGDVQADTLLLGPFTLNNAAASVRIVATGVEIPSLDAGIFGGKLHGKVILTTGDKPTYSVTGEFTQVNPAQIGPLMGMKWTGGDFAGSGQVELTGFTDKDLSDSAKGTVHFVWNHGSVNGSINGSITGEKPTGDTSSGETAIPSALARFDHWSGDAAIADGSLTLKENRIQRGARKSSIEAAVTFAIPAEVHFSAPTEAQATKP